MPLILVLLIGACLVSAYQKGGMDLALSYVFLFVGIMIAAWLFRIGLMILRADPVLYERNRSLIRATRLWNRRARDGRSISGSACAEMQSLQQDGLLTAGMYYDKKRNAIVPYVRLSERALFAAFRRR